MAPVQIRADSKPFYYFLVMIVNIKTNEDSKELNQENLEMIEKSKQDIKNGKVYSLSQIKKELNL
ncbi:MAG: hypothetical protein PHN56_02070 [Candidatus Nanoarchaeia archaeon]|nr:hypothetical protein [Candidatus Nanoarchaeia archaeon]